MGKIRLVFGASILLLVSGQVGAALYRITDLGTLGGDRSFGRSVNNFGEVAGYGKKANGDRAAFRYSNGIMQELDTSDGEGINNGGQVTGTNFRVFPSFAYINDNGTTTNIGTLGGLTSQGYAINDNGHVTGSSRDATEQLRAFVYKDNAMTNLGTLVDGANFKSEGADINNSGEVAGFSNVSEDERHAFKYSNGTMTDLGTLNDVGESFAYGINSIGQVTGSSDTTATGPPFAPGQSHAFFYSGGTMTDLGVLGDDDTSIGIDISDSGQVVGFSYDADDVSTGFLWDGLSGMVDINTLIDPEDPLAELFHLRDAYSISDNGDWITGTGYINGQLHAYLLGSETLPVTLSLLSDITPCETSTITCLHIPEISNLDADDVEDYTGTDSQLTLFYKTEFDEEEPNGAGDEFGLYKDNYFTEYITDGDGEPTGADIFHDLGDIINCAECYLVVKDGRQGDPAQYLFDISDSGDLMTMALNGFWDGEGVKGSISNIAIYGVNPVPVPAAAWLFGTALIGLIGFSKRRKAA